MAEVASPRGQDLGRGPSAERSRGEREESRHPQGAPDPYEERRKRRRRRPRHLLDDDLCRGLQGECGGEQHNCCQDDLPGGMQAGRFVCAASPPEAKDSEEEQYERQRGRNEEA